MTATRPFPTGQEVTFGDNELIVSKTDLQGKITYANDVFCRVSGYSQNELVGAPHSIMRHPAMPRSVFKLLWNEIQAQREIFAYVLNLGKNGSHYWVFAHVTPSFDLRGRHVGYHSNRRRPHPDAIAKVKPLYARLLDAEKRAGAKQDAVAAGTALLHASLATAGVPYGRFVFGLSTATSLDGEAA